MVIVTCDGTWRWEAACSWLRAPVGQQAQSRREREGLPREVLEKGPGHTSVCTLIFAGPMLVQSSGKTVPGESGVCEFSGGAPVRGGGQGAGSSQGRRPPTVQGQARGRREGREAGTKSPGLRCQLRQSPQSRGGPRLRATLPRSLASGSALAPALLSRAQGRPAVQPVGCGVEQRGPWPAAGHGWGWACVRGHHSAPLTPTLSRSSFP